MVIGDYDYDYDYDEDFAWVSRLEQVRKAQRAPRLLFIQHSSNITAIFIQLLSPAWGTIEPAEEVPGENGEGGACQGEHQQDHRHHQHQQDHRHQ